MKKDSLFTSDRCAGFATKLKGGCETFQGSLINRLTRSSVPLLLLIVAIGHLTAARVEGQAGQPTHQAILQSVGAVQTTVNSIETKVDNIKAKLDLIPPAWSQILPAADRFQLVMGGAAVLDKETGLVWVQSPDTTFPDWWIAQQSCINSPVGGRMGWRLPTIQELTSLVDPTQSLPALPSGHPFNVQSSLSSFYWSATTNANPAFSTSHAWGVNLGSGGVSPGVAKTSGFLVWCVRGGQGVDPQ
jgi:hypothetical protein